MLFDGFAKKNSEFGSITNSISWMINRPYDEYIYNTPFIFLGKVYKIVHLLIFETELDYYWADFDRKKYFQDRVDLEKDSSVIFLKDLQVLLEPGYSIKFLYKNKIVYYHFTCTSPFINNIKDYLVEI